MTPEEFKIHMKDISKDVKHWTNTGFARYYGVKTVRVE